MSLFFRFLIDENNEINGCECFYPEIKMNARYTYAPGKGLIFTSDDTRGNPRNHTFFAIVNEDFKPTGTPDNRRKDFRREIVSSYQFQSMLKTAMRGGYVPDRETAERILANVPTAKIMDYVQMLGGFRNE